MGYGSYSSDARAFRAEKSGYTHTHAGDVHVFTQAAKREIHPDMDPKAITARECRDSPDHPNTIPVIFALDVTGSMRDIPVQLIKTDLPKIMERLIAIHPDISLMFMAVGDHEYDSAPLQVGQFEASDELLDHWLTRCFLEGGGGSNPGESYALPWLFAAASVTTDHWIKRGQKGVIITVGDEPILDRYSEHSLIKHLGEQNVRPINPNGQHHITKEAIHAMAAEKWAIHHIHMGNNHMGWDIVGQNLRKQDRSPHVVDSVVQIVKDHLEAAPVASAQNQQAQSPPDESIPTPL